MKKQRYKILMILSILFAVCFALNTVLAIVNARGVAGILLNVACTACWIFSAFSNYNNYRML